MSHHTYKHIEVTGSSEVSSDDAIRNAVESVSKTFRNLGWFEVIDTRGHLIDGGVKHWQVTIKIGYRLDA